MEKYNARLSEITAALRAVSGKFASASDLLDALVSTNFPFEEGAWDLWRNDDSGDEDYGMWLYAQSPDHDPRPNSRAWDELGGYPCFTCIVRDGWFVCEVGYGIHSVILEFSPDGNLCHIYPDSKESSRCWASDTYIGRVREIIDMVRPRVRREES